MRRWVALSLLLLMAQPAWAWETNVQKSPASGDLFCHVQSLDSDLSIVRVLWKRPMPVWTKVAIGTEHVPGSLIFINVDNEHYFSGAEDDRKLWFGVLDEDFPGRRAGSRLTEMVAAILGGHTAWVKWTKWPGDTMQQEIDLAGIKAAYDECVKATNP